MECLPDGDVVTCGNVTPFDTAGWLAALYRYTPTGQERWHRYYRFLQSPQSVHDLKDVEYTDDGGFILTGTTQLSLSFPTVTWLLRVDQFGCLEPGCQSVGIAEQLVGLPKDALTCSPVPATERVTITLDLPPEITVDDKLRLVITDLQGRTMLETGMDGPFPITRNVEVFAWTPGIYVAHVADRSRLLCSTKIMVQ